MQKTANHPNIVKYKGSFLNKDKLWFVMEYMNGGALTDLIEICKLTESQISAVCKEVS